jgi:hypothetical protein
MLLFSSKSLWDNFIVPDTEEPILFMQANHK